MPGGGLRPVRGLPQASREAYSRFGDAVAADAPLQDRDPPSVAVTDPADGSTICASAPLAFAAAAGDYNAGAAAGPPAEDSR